MRILSLNDKTGLPDLRSGDFHSNWDAEVDIVRALHVESQAAGIRTPIYVSFWRFSSKVATLKLRDYADTEGRARALDEAYFFAAVMRCQEIFVALDSYYKVKGGSDVFEGLLLSRSIHGTTELHLQTYLRTEDGIVFPEPEETEDGPRFNGHCMHDVDVNELDAENIIGTMQYRCRKEFDFSNLVFVRAAARVLNQRGHQVEIAI